MYYISDAWFFLFLIVLISLFFVDSEKLAQKSATASTKWGELTASKTHDYLKTGLREGFVATRSPMCNPGETI